MRCFILCILTCSLTLAHVQHFQQALSLLTENKRTEAKRLLNKRIEIYGDNEDTEYKQLELLVKRSDIDGLIKELGKAYQRYPDNVPFANMKYNPEANVNKDKSKADTVLETFLSNHYNEQLLDILVNDKMALGKKEEAPKNVSYSCPALNYSLHFEVKPDRVIATREVKYLAEEVPTSEFAAFKEALNKMVAADKKQIAFK